MPRMAGGEVLVRIPTFNQSSGFVRPLLIPEAVEIIAKVIVDVRERAEPGHRVADIPPLVLTTRRSLGVMSGDVQNRRQNNVALPGETCHALPLLPVRDVKAREIDPG